MNTQNNKKKLTGGAYTKHIKNLPEQNKGLLYSEIKVSYERNTNTPKVNSSKKADEIFREIWDKERFHLQEQIYVLLLDVGCNLLGWKMVNTGLRNSVQVDMSFLAQMVAKSGAQRIILAHNHPSGTLKESKQDRDITEHIFDFLQPFMVNIEDHLILTESGYFSFVDNWIFDRYKIKHRHYELENYYRTNTGGAPSDPVKEVNKLVQHLNDKVTTLEKKLARKEAYAQRKLSIAK